MMHIYYSPIFRESVLCSAKGKRSSERKRVLDLACIHSSQDLAFLPSSPVPERIFKFSVTTIPTCMDKNKMLYKSQAKLVKN